VGIEVHEQESKVRSHVRITESLVELYAVEDEDLFAQTDMLQVEVSVAIPDLPVSDPFLEEREVTLHEAAIALPDFAIGFR
jgi:hypothetical protein